MSLSNYEEEEKLVNLLNKNPSCAAQTERRGEKTREGVKSVVGLLDRMRCGKGIKDLDDKSRGMEILMNDDFTKCHTATMKSKKNW